MMDLESNGPKSTLHDRCGKSIYRISTISDDKESDA